MASPELLSFLVREIALDGRYGCPIPRLFTFVSEFYANKPQQKLRLDTLFNPDQQDDFSVFESTPSPEPEYFPSTQVSESIRKAVWAALQDRKDLVIGRNNEGHALSLEEIEKDDEERRKKRKDKGLNNGETELPPEPPEPEIKKRGAVPPPVPMGELEIWKLYADEDQQWRALCGHGIDRKKVPPACFALLAEIGRARKGGILQPNVSKLCEQDPRSVATRTKSLDKLGYIEKKPVLALRMRTSLLTLRAYVEKKGSGTVFLDDAKKDGESRGKVVDMKTMTESIFATLRDAKNNCLMHFDLKRKVYQDMRLDTYHNRVFARMVRKLEAAGYLRRILVPVKVPRLPVRRFGKGGKGKGKKKKQLPAPTASKLVFEVRKSKCVRLERDFVAGELDEYLRRTTGNTVERMNAEPDEDEEEGDEDEQDEVPSGDEEMVAEQINAALESKSAEIITVSSTKPHPEWQLARPFESLLYHQIADSGMEGISSLTLHSRSAGRFYYRPIDQYLLRMTSNPQWQQPYYLRAKAVVRETDVSGRNINYRYFTLSNHNQLVADGVAEPLEDKPQTSSQKARMVNQGLTNENFDQWGFPIFDKQMFLFDDKVGGIYEAQRRIRQIEDRRGLVGHIRVSRRPGGALGVDWSSVKTYAQRDIYKRGITVEQYESISYQGLSTPNHYVMPKSVEDGLGVMSKSKKPRKVDMLGNTIRGRPRKYMPGTEPYKSAGWRQASAQRALEKTAAAGLPVPEELKKYAEGDFGEEEGEGTPKSKKKGKTPKIPKTPKTPKAAGTKGKKGKVVVEGDAAPSMDIDTPLAGPDTEQAEVPFTPMDIDTPSHPPKPTHNELSIPPSPTPVGEESTTVPGATLQPPAPPPPPPFRIVLPYAKKDKPSLNEEPAQAPAPFRIRQPYLPHKASVAQSPLGITPEASRVGAPPTPGTPTPSTAVKPRGRPPGKKTQVAGGKRQSKLSDLFGASAKKQKTTDTPSDSTPQTPTQPSATASPSPPTDDALLSHQLSQEMAAASSSPAQTPAQTSATAPERRGRASKADRLSTPAQNETAIAFAPGPNGFAYPYYPQPPPGYQWAYPPPHSQQGMVWGMPGQMPMQMMAPMAPMAPIAPMGQMMGPGGAVYMQAPPPGMDMKPPDSPSMLRARLMGMPMIPFDSEKNDRGGEGGKEAGEKQMEENADKLMEEASGVPETPKQTKKPLTEPPPSSATKRSTRPSKAAEEVEQVEASLAPTAPMEPPGSRTPSPRLTRRQLAQLQTSAEKVTPSPSAATKRQSSKPPTPSTSQSITSPRLTRRQAAAQALASPSPAQTVPSPVGPPLRRRGRQAAKSKEAESPKTPSGRQLLAVEINTPGSLRTRLMGGKMIEMEVAEEEEQLEASVETTEESKTTAPVAPNPKPAPEEPEAEPAAEAAIEPAPATKSDSEMEVVDGEDKENEVEAVPKSKRGRPKKRKRGFALAKAVKEMEIENPQNGTSKDVEYTDASSETHAAKKVRFEETKSLGGLPASEAAMETDIQAADATMSLPEAMEEDDVGPATGPSTAPIDLDASSPATETSGDTFDRQIVEVTDPDRNPNNDVFVQAINSRARRRLPSSDKKGYGGAGGMLSIARRQVILDLLEEYGGVFPGGMELRHAFKEKIMERNPKAGTPDRRLIVNVLNTLQSQGKVREIGFVFNNKRGMKVNKRIIMKANLSTDSPEVTAVKEEMVKADGTLWFPEGFKVTGLQIKHPPPPEVSRQMQEPTEVLEFERLYPASVINTKKAKEVAANIRELKRSLTIPPTASEALEILRHAKERDGEAHRTLNEIGKRNQAGRVKDQSKNWLLRIMNKDAEDLFSMDDGDESWMPRSLPPEIVQSEKSGVAFKPNLPEFPQTVADVEKGVDSVVFWEMYGHIRPEAVWDPTKELPEGTLIFINHYCPPLELCDNFDQEPVYFQDQVMKRVRFMNNPRQQNIDHAPGEKRPNGRPKGARPKVTGDEPVQFVWDKKRKKNIRKRHKAMEELYQEKAVVQDDPLLDSLPDRTIIGRKKYIFNKEEDDLLLYGTTIVRGLLSAASDRRIDWEIVKKILPHREIAALKSRWSTVRTLNKPRLRQLQADLEDCFLEDYAKGILPDFDPAKFDMVFHVNWFKKRMQAIDKPIPELPADYREFDEKFIVQEEQPTPDWRDAMFNSMLASGIRQEFFTNVSSSVPLSSLTSEEPEQTEQEKAQENARLVIKSNLVTDGSVYNQQEAYKLLGTFPQPSMHSAFETLSAKRTLAQCKPGIKVVPGRNFEFTDLFHQTFKSAPSLKIVRQAVAAERDLYSAFANGYEGYQLTHFVTDGMVAVLVNGLASGWLRFKREGFKADKRGLIEGYKTRMMDKKLLYFSITAIPTTVLPPPPEHLPLPSFEPSQGLGAYRTWFDINKTLVRGMWDTVRCAVVCTLLARPGVGINEIARLLGTGLEVREVREIVRWGLENDVLRVDSIENGERGMRVWAGERWWRGII